MAAMGYFAYQDRCKQSLVANIHQIFTKFLLSTLRWITLCEFENQLICISKMAAMSLTVGITSSLASPRDGHGR